MTVNATADDVSVARHRPRQLMFVAGLLFLLIPALVPLFRAGFFVSDDGAFHLYRTAALANAWTQGVLHPRLFPEFGFGYGQAVLNFYAPLSYWPGAFLALAGVGPVVAVKLTIALGFVLAALAMYGYVNWLWGPWAGLLAAVVYTYFPYHLVDAYIRGALPEHMAFIFPPLILWSFTAGFGVRRHAISNSQSPIPNLHLPFLWAALAYAALVLTHNLTALIMTPVTIAYVLLLAGWTGRWRRLWSAAGALLLALGLSAFYWLPVLIESNAVGLAIGPSTGFANHVLTPAKLIASTIFYPYLREPGVPIVYPLSWLFAVLPIGVSGLLLWRWRRRQQPAATLLLVFHIGLVLVAVFMTSTLSLFLWRPLTPILGHLQYPWRFLLLAALGMAVVAGALIPLLPKVRPSYLLAGVTLLTLLVALPRLPIAALPMTAAEAWSPQRMWDEDAATGQIGATWTGEFLPLAVTEQRWAIGRSRLDASDTAPLPAPFQAVLTEVSYDSLVVELDSPANMELRLHQFAQPGWRATIDGAPANLYASGELALATVAVPSGVHRITFGYGRTTARLAGALISLLSVIIWCILAWFAGRVNRWLRIASVTLAILTLALSLNSLGIGQRTRTPAPVQTQLEDVAQLIAWEAMPARGADDAVDVTLYWLALRETDTDYKAFVHLLDDSGQVVAQHDGDPVGGYTPTTRWRPGEIIADSYRLILPAAHASGPYAVRAGLYELTENGLRNLRVQPATTDGRVELGFVEIQ